MKLLQLNVWMGRLTRKILPLIEREDPDILTVQEVFDVDGRVFFPDNTFNILEQLEKLGYGYVHFEPNYSVSIGGKTAYFGNATLSRFPIREKKVVFSNGKFQPQIGEESQDNNIRSALFTTIDTGDDNLLHVVNHHAYWEPDPGGSSKSVAAMQIVADELKKIEGPLIFTGDLNLNPGTQPLQLFDGWLEDLTATHGLRTTLSELGIVENVACDHIFVNKLIQVQRFAALDDLVSDHKALVLEFSLAHHDE